MMEYPIGCSSRKLVPDFRVRAHFYEMRQSEGETVYEWFRRVQATAHMCHFDSDDDAVKDKFITGMRPGLLADRLLSERSNKRLQEVLELAVDADIAQRVQQDRMFPVETIHKKGTVVGKHPAVVPDNMLDTVRECLKLYQYSSEECVGDFDTHFNYRIEKYPYVAYPMRNKDELKEEFKYSELLAENKRICCDKKYNRLTSVKRDKSDIKLNKQKLTASFYNEQELPCYCGSSHNIYEHKSVENLYQEFKWKYIAAWNKL